MNQESQNDIQKITFEEAISATKFGKFNIFLLLAVIPCAMSSIIDGSVMSFVIPVAQCDLNLSLQEKGLLNASYSIGFIISAYFWGILADTIGRKNILLFLCAMDFLINITSSFLKTFWLQFIFKFLGGFFISGAYGLVMAYAVEFHSSKYRSTVLLIIGLSITFTLPTMPLLVWFIMPLGDLSLNKFVIHSWQIYIVILTIPSLLATILFMFLPESPKYLMSVGRKDEALNILRKMYKMNTGELEDTYQCKDLIDESFENTSSFKNSQKLNILQIIYKAMLQLKPMWQQPYLEKILLTTTSHFGILLSSNTIRLWLPQLFTSIDEHNQLNGINDSSLCQVITYSFENVTIKYDNETKCTIVQSSNLVYISLIITGLACFITSILLMFIINYCRKNYLMILFLIIGGSSTFGTLLSLNIITTFVLLVINIVFTAQSSIILMSLTVEIFPTGLRAMASSLTILAGQFGSLVGNLMFPYLLSLGCVAPFAFIGGIILLSALLCIFIPNSNLQSFK